MLIHPSKPKVREKRPAAVSSTAVVSFDDPLSRLGQGHVWGHGDACKILHHKRESQDLMPFVKASPHECVDARACWLGVGKDDIIYCLPSAIVFDITAHAIEGESRSPEYNEMLRLNSNFLLVEATAGRLREYQTTLSVYMA